MEEQRNDELSLLAWMNVVLSFLFMVVAVPLLLWLLSLLLAPNWHRLIFSYPFSVGILQYLRGPWIPYRIALLQACQVPAQEVTGCRPWLLAGRPFL